MERHLACGAGRKSDCVATLTTQNDRLAGAHPRDLGDLATTAKREDDQTYEGQPAQQRQTSPPEEPQEATRIPALLRDRFGPEY